MEALIEYIAKSLVDRPDQVAITATDAEGGRLFELTVAPDDIGKVIGRDGRTVNAIRTLVAIAAQRKGFKTRVEIKDDRRAAAGPQGSAPGTPVEAAEPPAAAE